MTTGTGGLTVRRRPPTPRATHQERLNKMAPPSNVDATVQQLRRNSALLVLFYVVPSRTHLVTPLKKTRIVYPRLLEARSPDSPLKIFVNDEITLNLERADVFPDMFLLRYFEGETEVNEYIKGSDLSNKVYHDRDQMAAVSIERDNGIRVEGTILKKYQIRPMNRQEQSDAGFNAHELSEVEEPFPNTREDLPEMVNPELYVLFDANSHKSMDKPLKAAIYVAILTVSRNKDVFITVLGDKAYMTLRNLVFPETPEKITYQQIREVLLKHDKPKRYIVTEDHDFHKRTQGRQEPFDDFVVELKCLATNCAFGAFLSDALRDQLVVGVRSEGTRYKLLAVEDGNDLTWKRRASLPHQWKL
ncbi:uncharacterized protein LOC120846730 [Ixodes scapularis]|uniref:uncharacterized protein LOC120846730 n=1 Tax=Ixodes scapularis TaxID=6945 RepID=UPI001A9F1D10|nr:uncharacterized protein LOC120846730 [Ixodes scapularis]